ncbi:MAG: hypothetical protein D3920_08460 [Candidatus Electrothrix sp. AW2]|nr:hypothetical protein [Candidatus Electrothrix gigas]MCI5226817.1 hypothetical protein [Candidatus Electrothrix gigas]
MQKKQISYRFLLIALLIGIIYSNTLDSSWHLDDEPNILHNPYLHLTDLYPKSLATTLISGSDWSDPTFYRPVACFTFALNWYFGQDNPTGYHIVNITIHIITTFFLFLVIRQIMHLIDNAKEKDTKKYFIALLAAILWAVAPIQTQAVTYIVQRMASLAAMFTILAIYSYLKARTEKQYIRWGTLCVLFFLAAIGSKENAVMLPASLLLLEFSFFNTISKQRLAWIAVISLAILLTTLFVMHFFLGSNLLNIFDPTRLIDSYESRSFTLSERILSQPRIILIYLSQIFIPSVSQLSLVHNIQLSTSFFTPWTTLPAIVTIFALLSLSVFFLKKYPLFSFPVLFFFLNHIVESTILPLELVFEHRNYLPSFFLFLPLSFFIGKAVYAQNSLSPVGRFAIIVGTVCFLILSGHATYMRNFAWADEGTLWTDTLQKAPSSPRAAGFLGRLYQSKKQYKKALYYFQHALDNSHLASSPKKLQILVYKAIGDIYYASKKYKKSIHYFNQCIEIKKNNELCLTQRAKSYLQLDLPQQALEDADIFIEEYPAYPLGKYIAASASYRLGELASAQKYMQKIIKKSLTKPEGLYLMGLILLKHKSYPNALFFIRRATALWPSNAKYQFTLAAVYYLDNDYEKSQATLAHVFDKYPIAMIQQAIYNLEQHDLDSSALNYIVNTLNVRIEASLILSEGMKEWN